jgi:hypothetical protein
VKNRVCKRFYGFVIVLQPSQGIFDQLRSFAPSSFSSLRTILLRIAAASESVSVFSAW